MSEVRPQDILLRVGGRTLLRHGVLAWAGSNRANEFKETFTRASVRRFRDRDLANGTIALGRKAGNDNVAIEYPAGLSGLVDAQGLPYCGPRLDGGRTQLVTDPENFGNWTAINVTRTAGQADPFGGTAAYKLDATAGGDNRIQQAVAGFTSGTRAILVFLRADPASAQSNIRVTDSVGGSDRHYVRVTWTAGVPSLSTIAGSGTLFGVEPWGASWYAILINADNVVASDLVMIYPATTNGTGTVYAFGFNAWNSPFPSSYQGPGESAGAADALTTPFNFGLKDVTVLARMARPLWADYSGAIVISPGVFSLGTADSRWAMETDNNSRVVKARIQPNGAGVTTASTAILAGAEQTWLAQYDRMTSGARALVDVGGGPTSFTSESAAHSTFGSQTLKVGQHNDQLFGVLLDLIFANGLRTLAEMLAIP